MAVTLVRKGKGFGFGWDNGSVIISEDTEVLLKSLRCAGIVEEYEVARAIAIVKKYIETADAALEAEAEDAISAIVPPFVVAQDPVLMAELFAASRSFAEGEVEKLVSQQDWWNKFGEWFEDIAPKIRSVRDKVPVKEGKTLRLQYIKMILGMIMNRGYADIVARQ